jgi:hypothetical protein
MQTIGVDLAFTVTTSSVPISGDRDSSSIGIYGKLRCEISPSPGRMGGRIGILLLSHSERAKEFGPGLRTAIGRFLALY